MSLELDPVELGFKRPFQHEVSQTLRLKNPHSDPVAFKVGSPPLWRIARHHRCAATRLHDHS
ncbi:hypothetical protein LEMA_uP045370.1 [Plenodomus lingam JN3]|uniref:MSP domain-containing protein n=1 Tax=Leptosphaeria maculans (strain JN3 / isolate v23.1.3 / race Av1-4-5-6-7-8) TaxID=985895 RepID=E5R463_LEPMJ|nr:hypothetical protein LEMA_uP045370.1 [Plenodomus lingam JN3]CBX91831.1 hypothetical protein LEMA_uP045370.1 [Plenodomus lingam JN3]